MSARQRRRIPSAAVVIDAPTRGLLATGKLEQTCRDCGRWEAAHAYCSWCLRPMTPADWYRNGVVEERRNRIPAMAPANPPDEYRSVSAWPQKWGVCPYARRAVSPPTTPVIPTPDVISGASGQTQLFR